MKKVQKYKIIKIKNLTRALFSPIFCKPDTTAKNLHRVELHGDEFTCTYVLPIGGSGLMCFTHRLVCNRAMPVLNSPGDSDVP